MIKKRPYFILLIIVLNIIYPYKAFGTIKNIESVPDKWILLEDYIYNIVFSIIVIIISLIIKKYLILILQLVFLIVSFILINNQYPAAYIILLIISALYLSYLVFLMIKSFVSLKK